MRATARRVNGAAKAVAAMKAVVKMVIIMVVVGGMKRVDDVDVKLCDLKSLEKEDGTPGKALKI